MAIPSLKGASKALTYAPKLLLVTKEALASRARSLASTAIPSLTASSVTPGVADSLKLNRNARYLMPAPLTDSTRVVRDGKPSLKTSTQELALVSLLEERTAEQVKRDKAPDVAIISGASGLIGPHLALKSLEEGRSTILITRDKATLEIFGKHSLCRVIEASEEQQADPRFMSEQIAKLCAGRRITYVNGLGVASVPAGSKAILEKINFAPFHALLSHLEDGKKTGLYQDCRVVHLGSIALSILRKSGEPIEDPYILSRAQTAKRLSESSLDHLHLGVSYGYCGPENGRLNMKHGWGPDQMANFFVQVLIGSGEQIVQPVHIRDIVDAVFAFKGGRLDIDAVGPDKMTVKQFFKAFCDRMGTKFRPVHISHEMAEKIADIYANGHVAPYAVVCSRILEKQDLVFDHQPMAALLGRDLTSFHETFKEFQVGSFMSASPPIYEQIKGMLINASLDPVKFEKLVSLLIKECPGFSLQVMKALLKD